MKLIFFKKTQLYFRKHNNLLENAISNNVTFQKKIEK